MSWSTFFWSSGSLMASLDHKLREIDADLGIGAGLAEQRTDDVRDAHAQAVAGARPRDLLQRLRLEGRDHLVAQLDLVIPQFVGEFLVLELDRDRTHEEALPVGAGRIHDQVVELVDRRLGVAVLTLLRLAAVLLALFRPARGAGQAVDRRGESAVLARRDHRRSDD